MANEKVTREKIVELYDRMEEAKAELTHRELALSHAKNNHADARNAYEDAIREWNSATEQVSKEITK